MTKWLVRNEDNPMELEVIETDGPMPPNAVRLLSTEIDTSGPESPNSAINYNSSFDANIPLRRGWPKPKGK